MKIESLQPPTDSRVRFAYPGLAELPSVSGCYVLTTVEDHIVYVGQTTNIASRANGHFNDPQKRIATPYGVAFWFYYLCCENIKLNALERGWLNQFEITAGCLPYFNKQHAPV